MRAHYQVLDGLRGTAALSVVLFHIFEWITPDWQHSPLHHNYLAVDFFFALSGFVVGCAYDGRMGKAAEPKFRLSFWAFVKRRLIRLHPMVPIATVAGLLGFLFDPNVGTAQTVGIAISPEKLMLIFTLALFLLPTPGLPNTVGETHPINGPSWTLFLEYIANALYALFGHRMNRTVHVVLCLIAAVATVLAARHFNLLGQGWSWELYWMAPIRIAYPFLAGLLVYRLGLKIRIPQPFLLLSLALILVFALPWMGEWNGYYEAGCVILVFPLILICGAGVTKVEGILAPVCRFFGELSYPIYIIHYPLIYMFGHWVWNTHPERPKMMMVAGGLFLVEIALGTLLLYCYDKPVRAWLTKRYVKV